MSLAPALVLREGDRDRLGGSGAAAERAVGAGEAGPDGAAGRGRDAERARSPGRWGCRGRR